MMLNISKFVLAKPVLNDSCFIYDDLDIANKLRPLSVNKVLLNTLFVYVLSVALLQWQH